MLFLGIAIETAATLVPASAMKRAAHAINIDGVGLRLRSRFMGEDILLDGFVERGVPMPFRRQAGLYLPLTRG